SRALWMLGYPDTALADAERALDEAREISQAGTSLFALLHAPMPYICCGYFVKSNAIVESFWHCRTQKARNTTKQAAFFSRLDFGCDRQSVGRHPSDYRRDCYSGAGYNNVAPATLDILGKILCR